ncbi:MAG: sugar phosphate nucleotidyltransferase [Candidatus Aminicenantia bacterium]
MKALILAAGLGTRLQPLTVLKAKPAIPFHNKPLIVHLIDNLKKEGIQVIAINLHHLPLTIKQAVKDVKGVEITFSLEPDLLGTAGGLKKLEYSFEKEENLLLINGDTYQNIPVKKILKYHLQTEAIATLMVKENHLPEEYPSLETDSQNNIVSIHPPRSNAHPLFMFCGAQILSSRIFNYIPENTFSDIISDIFPLLFKHKEKIKAYYYHGPWAEISTPQKYLEASLNYLPLDKNVIDRSSWIDCSAKIERSIIGKDSRIDKNVILKNSIIWERVEIGANSIIDHCIITNDIKISPQSKIVNKILIPQKKRFEIVSIKRN